MAVRPGGRHGRAPARPAVTGPLKSKLLSLIPYAEALHASPPAGPRFPNPTPKWEEPDDRAQVTSGPEDPRTPGSFPEFQGRALTLLQRWLLGERPSVPPSEPGITRGGREHRQQHRGQSEAAMEPRGGPAHPEGRRGTRRPPSMSPPQEKVSIGLGGPPGS